MTATLTGSITVGAQTLTPTTAIAPGLKHPLTGLVWMGQAPPQAFWDGGGSGVDLFCQWTDLSTTADGAILPGNPVDALVTRIRKTNPGVGIKLRIMPTSIPAAVTALDGGPLSISAFGIPATVGRFWAPGMCQAWKTLMATAAARWDTTPEIREVCTSYGGIVFGEPMVRSCSDAIAGTATTASLWAAGWRSGTPTALEPAHLAAIDGMTAWHFTRVSLTLNPYSVWTSPTAKTVQSMPYVDAVMDHAQTVLGPRLVMGNQELGRPDFYAANGGQAAINADMKRRGVPLYFQQANDDHVPGRTGADYLRDWAAAVTLGACQVEIYPTCLQPPGGTPVTAAQMVAAGNALRSNWT